MEQQVLRTALDNTYQFHSIFIYLSQGLLLLKFYRNQCVTCTLQAFFVFFFPLRFLLSNSNLDVHIRSSYVRTLGITE